MARPGRPVNKKKTRDDDDEEEEAPVKKKNKNKKASKTAKDEDADDDADADEDEEDDDEADDDDDADDEAEDEDEDDSDDKDDEDEESDDDDSDADDDDEDSDDDDSDDDDDEEDDDDDTPAKGKKKSKSSAATAGVSWDPEDAEVGGLPEGRIVLLNPRTRLGSTADYKEDDPDGVPLFSLDAVPSGKKWDESALPFEIHLTAGKVSRIVPNDDGTDFVPAEGSHATGLSKSSNTYFFIKSLTDAGFPVKKMRMKGIATIHGTVVELQRVPQPKRNFAAAAEGEKQGGDSMPSVQEIYSLPWESKGQKERDRAEAVLAKFKAKSGKRGKKGAKKGRPKGEGVSDEGGGDSGSLSAKAIKKLADKAVLAAIKSPAYRKKGLPLAEVFTAAFQQVRKHPERQEIMALVKRTAYIEHDDRPWLYDDKTERLKLIS